MSEKLEKLQARRAELAAQIKKLDEKIAAEKRSIEAEEQKAILALVRKKGLTAEQLASLVGERS